MNHLESIKNALQQALEQLHAIDRSDLNPMCLLVVGCSSSEIIGGQIGKASSPEVGELVAKTVLDFAEQVQVAVAFQCCEHLNRALVVQRQTVEKYGLTPVSVVPVPSAGGSCGAAAYKLMGDAVMVEAVSADSGIDIGNTMIGMHMRPVAVPVRLSVQAVGEASIVCARTRPKLIGGPRAQYILDQA